MPAAEPTDPTARAANRYPAWTPRFWHGMRTALWWRLLARNRFKVALNRLPIALGVTAFTPCNDLLAITQSLLFGRAIRKTTIDKPPVFILGHWRSGTTLLHELLVQDPQFASPSTFQCFAPSHFILTEPLMVRYGGFLLPKTRPMDNMRTGWQLPQEDEFALMNLGVPTPYLRIAFPQSQPKDLEYLSLRGLSETELAWWRSRFLWFIRALTYHYAGKQLVLKSPPHTGRMAELARLFPGAKFIHLTRDPRKLFTSTMRLWKALDEVQGLHASPSDAELKPYVVECLTRMYEEFEAARQQVDSQHLIDVRYEDLVADPIATLRRLYEHLQLGDFSSVEPLVSQRVQHDAGYRTNTHQMDQELEQEILAYWPDYAQRYGYG